MGTSEQDEDNNNNNKCTSCYDWVQNSKSQPAIKLVVWKSNKNQNYAHLPDDRCNVKWGRAFVGLLLLGKISYNKDSHLPEWAKNKKTLSSPNKMLHTTIKTTTTTKTIIKPKPKPNKHMCIYVSNVNDVDTVFSFIIWRFFSYSLSLSLFQLHFSSAYSR